MTKSGKIITFEAASDVPLLSVNGLRNRHQEWTRTGPRCSIRYSARFNARDRRRIRVAANRLFAARFLGALPPGLNVTSGSILYNGIDLSRLDPNGWRALRGTRISAVFQDPGSYLNPSIPVGVQLAEAMRSTLRLKANDARQRALVLLERVGFRNAKAVYQQYPFELSGGMAQRVLIAIAICAEPSLLIADEATNRSGRHRAGRNSRTR